jgi:hypothetical protein
MIDFFCKHDLAIFGQFSLCYINRDAANAHDIVAIVPAGGRNTDAPSNSPIGSTHSELGTRGLRVPHQTPQCVHDAFCVVWMNEGTHGIRRWRKRIGIQSEN